MNLSPRHRTFLINEQIIGPIIINFGLNASDGYFKFRDFSPVPSWTLPGAVLDLLSVLPLLPFIICLVTTPIVKHMVKKKKLAPLEFGPSAYPLLRKLPSGNLRRSTWFGVVSLVAVGPLLALAWLALGIEQIELWPFVIVKGALCAVMAAVVSPIAALYALAQAGESTGQTALEATADGDRAYAGEPNLPAAPVFEVDIPK